MKVWHLVFREDALTYTVAKALTCGGHEVFVWSVDREYENRAPSNLQQRLASASDVQVIPGDTSRLPEEIGHLVVQVFPRPWQCLQDFVLLAKRAVKITLITAGDRSKSQRQALKQQWFEARHLGRYFGKVDRVIYKDGFYPHDLYRVFKDRSVLGFDVHSQFLHSQDAFRAIHARDWSPEEPRPILVSFLGSQDPDSRKEILDSVRDLFLRRHPCGAVASTEKQMFWHEYSDADQAPLGPSEFLDVLAGSDFSLCPPGYSLVTHRPIEALLRGSIPVLPADHFDLYAVGLEDGVNCIGVQAQNWREAIQRVATMPENVIVELRKNIFSMFAERLCYEAVANAIRSRLGVAQSG